MSVRSFSYFRPCKMLLIDKEASAIFFHSFLWYVSIQAALETPFEVDFLVAYE